MNYWKQKAAPWVSFTVMVAGLVSAVILLWIVKFEENLGISITSL